MGLPVNNALVAYGKCKHPQGFDTNNALWAYREARLGSYLRGLSHFQGNHHDPVDPARTAAASYSCSHFKTEHESEESLIDSLV